MTVWSVPGLKYMSLQTEDEQSDFSEHICWGSPCLVQVPCARPKHLPVGSVSCCLGLLPAETVSLMKSEDLRLWVPETGQSKTTAPVSAHYLAGTFLLWNHLRGRAGGLAWVSLPLLKVVIGAHSGPHLIQIPPTNVPTSINTRMWELSFPHVLLWEIHSKQRGACLWEFHSEGELKEAKAKSSRNFYPPLCLAKDSSHQWLIKLNSW